ncbi:efflux RND transporter permease subunit [Desulfoferrobacter suflitae]|uniref:efflux RND transporter permease subunit n=1 Tax=Desulfoferrobacter suflitae TaxID=2865782 RepID=UPI00216498C8|nr:efflux RND transporter permease subunit [Desulfoferrobacter suflitae]MCK8603757.1 efflux RND transporter permease subunit [Desulfoferrobacter suflitae]
MKPHRFALDNPWLVLVGALLVTVLGLRAFFLMPVEYFPDTNPPQVAVVTVEPGAPAVDVARRITEVIEKEIATLSGLKKLTSTSRDEVSSVNAEFVYEKPIGEAVVDVQNAISKIRADLPADILEPRIYRITDATRPVLTLALAPKKDSALTLAQVRLLADNDITDYLLNLPGVADVDTFGGNQPQINIWLDRDRLRAFQLTPMEIAAAIKAQNITTPAGLMEGVQGEALVKTVGEFKDLRDVENLIVKRSADAYLRLEDVARVELGIEELRSLYHGNGRPAIGVNVLRPEGGNTIQAIHSVKQALPLMAAMWSDIDFTITNDQEPLIERNTAGMRASLYSAIVLTVLIIFLFLTDLRSSMLALVSIPLSFLFCLAALGFTGYTLNVVTLSGLIIATGMVVDATVVVVENINRHWAIAQKNPRETVEKAVGEILTSITAGMLTTVAMLIPIMFAGGYVEKVMRQFTLTVTLALLGSLLAAVLVIPPIAVRLLEATAQRRPTGECPPLRGARKFVAVVHIWLLRRGVRASQLVKDLLARLAEGYVALLRKGMRHRLLTVGAAFGLLIATVGAVMPVIGRELMPPMDTGIVNIVFELPPDALIQDLDRALTEIEKVVLEEPNVLMISSVVGSEPGQVSFGAGGQTAQKGLLTINLTTRDRRERSIWQIADHWRERIEEMPELRSLQIYEYGATPMSTSRAPIDIILTGRDSVVLDRLALELQDALTGTRGLLDFTPSWWLDKEEVQVRVSPRTARLYETDPQTLADQLRLAVGGLPVSGFRLSGFLDIPIQLAYGDEWVATPERLSELDIYTPKGAVPLRTLATVERAQSQTVISRENLENTIDLTGYNRTVRISQVLAEIGERTQQVAFPGGYGMRMSGTAAEMKESMSRMMGAMALGSMLLIVLLVGTFRSFLLPVPVLVAIPLALIGSLWGLLLLGKPMCMPAMMGIVLLAGIVINNSIFLIDFIKQAREGGMERQEALEQAVRLRMRPVLMTTISTVVGMLPIILETAVGLERMSPLGAAAGFGLLAGTVMTLVVTPVLYSLLDDSKEGWNRLRHRS